MSAEEFSRYDSMKLFLHQIYEFQKGVRSLVLCTMCRTCASLLSERLERLGIAYRIQSVTDSKVNLYFGNRMCLETVATFIHKPLNELSAEEDFMLGAMLGYDISMQCRRYCDRKSMKSSSGDSRFRGLCMNVLTASRHSCLPKYRLTFFSETS